RSPRALGKTARGCLLGPRRRRLAGPAGARPGDAVRCRHDCCAPAHRRCGNPSRPPFVLSRFPMPSRARYALAVLFAINLMNFFDRTIFGAIGETIRREWGLGDAAIGALGTAFTLLYAVVGVPFGRLSDKHARTRILAVGLFAWSFLTAASGLARSYWQLFAVRLGVGVGEATCAPAANSL